MSFMCYISIVVYAMSDLVLSYMLALHLDFQETSAYILGKSRHQISAVLKPSTTTHESDVPTTRSIRTEWNKSRDTGGHNCRSWTKAV